MVFFEKRWLRNGLISVWLIIMVSLPESSVFLRGGLLAGLIIYTLLFERILFRREMIFVLMIWELFFAAECFLSIVNGFKFSDDLFEIYLLRPIIYLLICCLIKTDRDLNDITYILVTVAVFTIGLNVLFIAQAYGMIPRIFEIKSVVIIGENMFTARLQNQGFLCFFVPYIICLYFHKSEYIRGLKNVVVITFVIGVLVSLLSGRRVLQIVCLLSLLLNAVKTVISSNNKRKIINTVMSFTLALLLIFALLFVIGRQFNFNIVEAIANTISAAFNSRLRTTTIRIEQTEYLISYWKERPFFGWGLSSYVREYSRSSTSETPWSYEHFYIALLFQIGIVGVAFLVIIVMLMFKKMLQVVKRNNVYVAEMLAIIEGSIFYFIAGFTNPMITTSWFWFIFISSYYYAASQNQDFKGRILNGTAHRLGNRSV